MPHFYIPPENIHDGKFFIEGSEARHISVVLRLKAGALINFFDGKGMAYAGKIISISKGRIEGVLAAGVLSDAGTAKIALYTAIAKGERFDWLIEKSCELGVNELIPVIAERSVTKEAGGSKLARWQRIAEASSKQSGRADIMKISGITRFSDALDSSDKSALSVIAWEEESKTTLNSVLRSNVSFKSVSIFIGPEGGFTHHEIEASKRIGIIPVSLGTNILRVETAGIAAVVIALNCSNEK
jgi:16S rRNA (uracil1498-N3)-methyltransferase